MSQHLALFLASELAAQPTDLPDPVLVVLGGLVSAICCNVLARTRGRNERWWWLWGFLFGPFAVLVLLLLPSRTQPPAAPS